MKFAAVVGVAAVELGKLVRRDSTNAMLAAVAPPASAMMYLASTSEASRIEVPYVKSAPVFVLLNTLNDGPAFGTTQLPPVATSASGAPVVALIGCGTRESSSPMKGVPETDPVVTPAPPDNRSWYMFVSPSVVFEL